MPVLQAGGQATLSRSKGMAAFPFPAPSLDASILEAIRMALLLSVEHPSSRVIDRILIDFAPSAGESPAIDLSAQDALGVFAALIKIEWERGRTEFSGIPIRSLVASWKAAIVPVLDRLNRRD